MDIGSYIADLLKKQDEVSLPGLGTFSKTKVSGSFDRVNNLFTPPSFQVAFSKETSESNSLVQYISAKKNLSPSSAEYFVKQFVSGITDLLNTSGIADLSPMGTIRQNDNNLFFDASTDFKVPGKFYGLKPLSDLVAPVQAAAVPELVTPPVHQGNSIEDFITGQGEEDEILEDEEVELTENRKNSSLWIFAGALMFVIIGSALLYLFNPVTKNLIDSMMPDLVKAPQKLPDPPKQTAIIPVTKPDSLNAQVPAPASDSTMIDSTANATEEELQSEPVSDVRKIEIIGATFGKRSEADTYVKTMKSRGFDAKIAEDMPGRLFKVSIGSFSDEETAQKELNKIVQDVEKKAWIAKYKPKKKK